MNPPIVYELTRPSAQRTSRTTAIVQSISFLLPPVSEPGYRRLIVKTAPDGSPRRPTLPQCGGAGVRGVRGTLWFLEVETFARFLLVKANGRGEHPTRNTLGSTWNRFHDMSALVRHGLCPTGGRPFVARTTERSCLVAGNETTPGRYRMSMTIRKHG